MSLSRQIVSAEAGKQRGFQVMPALSDDDFALLKSDIEARGVLVPVEYDEAGAILDGHHRVRACQELGVTDWPRLIREGLTDEEKRIHARQLNLARRHLNREQKRELVADQLRDTPEKSDRQVAAGLGVSPTTVGSVRKEVEPTVQDGQLKKRVGKDGKARSQPKPKKVKYVDNTPAGKAGAKDRAKELRDEESAAKKAANDDVAAQPVALPEGKFGTIVIDPPWQMEKIEREVRPNQVAFEYPTMDEKQLVDYGSTISDHAADDCHMFMWTTQKFLPMALRLLDTWSFRYVLTMVWHKPGGFQPIGLPQYNCEFAIYARKGSPKFIDTKAFNVCFDAPRREHSRKPDEFYDVIRRVTGEGRIDIFSREPRDGFAQLGNESDKFGEAA